MKKIILGSFMFLAGVISTALLLAGSMGNEWTRNGELSSWWNLSRYGLMPVVYIFAVITIIGLVLAVIGLMDKKQ